MTKDQFLSELDKGLRGLTFRERQDILLDYEEHFSIGLEEGKSEEEIAEKLGSPSQIAKEMMATYHLEKVDDRLTAGNIMRAVWAVIGLGFFNLVIVLGPFIALVAIIFSLWAVSLSFTLSPLMVIVDVVFHPGGFMLFNLFASIALCGLGILIGIGMSYITKWISMGFIRYLKWNASLVKGGM
ncbi:MAG: HAAS signaling domain-containing protein [Tuberibacillus sp.]